MWAAAISGNTVRALTEFGQDLASTEYGNAFNRAQNRANQYLQSPWQTLQAWGKGQSTQA
jgi:hypothetical protein